MILALLLRHENLSEGGSLERPQHARLSALDGGGARRVVEQRQLAEGVARPVRLDCLARDLLKEDRVGAALRDVKVVALLALVDEDLAGGGTQLEHRADDRLKLLIAQRGE